jgi:hypothetical protein
MTVATLGKTIKAWCPKCGARTEPVRDIDGETLPECRMCGWRGYKTAKQLGIDPEETCEITHKNGPRKCPEDAPGHLSPASGCQRATRTVGHQSSCFKCPFPRCWK